MRILYVLSIFGLLMTSHSGRAQDPDLEGKLDEETMNEAVLSEEGTQTLLLDNSRSKVGRDFYDVFFRHFAELPKAAGAPVPTDSTRKVEPTVELDLNAFIVTIDELPAFGIGTTIVIVSLNDQIIWQNYVQARPEIIEAYAFDAAELINQYVINFQDVQRSLESEDQRGTGVF